ncbi:hypothetical protein [Microbacterium immunditiarum]|uniref:Gfo/Idh/MocA-like oxidoreductase N-terminal domain-containing protein n=1 Tax=Microbacterium immunditiarum TaxID=337480 RepID=A0A7Y9GKN6_9MICO|nr:hypothetical protein [Microbacterium immunditiarum]NYE18229.1 hypothetical protein [Microbacterium immunditiarum]
MNATGVWTSVDAYRVAVAELPRSARLTESPRDAIAVVAGTDAWWHRAGAALADGALGVVVSRPENVPVDRLDALLAVGRPVTVERPLLRSDSAQHVVETLAATRSPDVIVVECHASPLSSALRDAIAWARAAAGDTLAVRTASFASGRELALLESASGVPVSLMAATQAGAPPDGRIRMTALGDTIVEVDGGDHQMIVTVTDAAARRIAPTRFERPERLALRRAIEAVTFGTTPPDLGELGHDEDVARTVRAASDS